jgi:predicted nucleotidyltransferase
LYFIINVYYWEVKIILNNQAKQPLSGKEMADLLLHHLKNLFEENKVDFAYLGGSWAKNKQNWWSDIDIFISIPNFLQLTSKIQLDFLTQFHVKATDLTKFEEFEILVLETLPLHVQFNAITNGILIFEKNPEVSSYFIEKLLPLYYDHMIWYKRLIDQSQFVENSGEKS